MPSISTLKRIGKSVCDKDYLNFMPTSDSIKPPHIANQLFRLCSGETCQIKDVFNWALSESKKGAISSEDIITQYSSVLDKGENESVENIKTFRFLLSEIFNQDITMYPSYDFSVMTIPSHWFVRSSVSSEANIGNFIFEILSKKINGNSSPVIKMIKDALSDDTDDFTRLVKPLITIPNEQEIRNIYEVEVRDDNEIKWDYCKEKIRQGFDRLAENLKQNGESKNSLLVLRRFVNFSIFSTFLYLTNANCSMNTNFFFEVPILIDAGTGLVSIKKASEQSFTLAKKSVENFFVKAIHKIIDDEISGNTKRNCINWINGMSFRDATEQKAQNSIISCFNSFIDEGNEPKFALARALQIALWTYIYKSSSPSDICRVLGIRAGLIGPKGNRATIKRYLLNSFMLETLTLSALSPDELIDGVEMKELSDVLIDQYNILIGADSEREFEILANVNIAQSTPGDLRGDLSINAKALADTFISLGLGKRYADGVTMIGWRL